MTSLFYISLHRLSVKPEYADQPRLELALPSATQAPASPEPAYWSVVQSVSLHPNTDPERLRKMSGPIHNRNIAWCAHQWDAEVTTQ